MGPIEISVVSSTAQPVSKVVFLLCTTLTVVMIGGKLEDKVEAKLGPLG